MTRTFELPPVPKDMETISVDLASFIVHTPGTTLVEIPLGDLLDTVDLNEITDRKELPLAVEFAIGPARYRITSLVLDPASFALVCEPANEMASRTTLGAQPPNIRLTDDQQRTYPTFLVGALWSPADDGGDVMKFQTLYFNGLPGSDTTSFFLRLGEKGEIATPFVFQVDIAQDDEEPEPTRVVPSR